MVFLAQLADCEALSDGLIAQQINTVTSLALVAVGVGLFRQPEPAVRLLALGAIAAGIGSVLYHGPSPGWASPVHDLTIAVAAATGFNTIRVVVRRWGPRQALRRLGLSGLAFGLGVLAHYLGRTAGPLCRPGSLGQWHGAWHLLAATAILALGRAGMSPPSNLPHSDGGEAKCAERERSHFAEGAATDKWAAPSVMPRPGRAPSPEPGD